MRRPPLIVLKFGGSVLLDENRLRIAVHEIYRWRRRGRRVIAVVSALAGVTDELLAQSRRLSPRASDHSVAALIARGELHSAALLGLHLDRAGVPASVISHAAARFRADGTALDARPVSIDTAVIRRGLDRDGVVVFPGFAALDDAGRTVTLGRGGSDLTALYLAHRLRAARCRLIKDVDGLYTHDPARLGPPPLRYDHATYDDALATDGSIIQHKAVRFAQNAGLRFELGRFNGTRPTTIGAPRSSFTDRPDEPRRLTVALLGAGTVGGGVLELAQQLPDLFEITGVASRTPRSSIDSAIPRTTDAAALAASSADVVVEAIGGLEPARTALLVALRNGSTVITANKAVLAAHGAELHAAAFQNGIPILASASVGGVAPILERVASNPDSVTSIRAVLNGTSNFVLEQLSGSVPCNDAIRRAQQLGLAEQDPSRDLDGRDAADKLRVIAATLGLALSDSDIRRECVIDLSLNAPPPGARLRQVAHWSRDTGAASVTLEAVTQHDPLFELPDEWNAAAIERRDGSTELVRGKGAGRWPTAEAVIADLLQLSRRASHAAGAINEPQEVNCG